ncbi:enolase-phosphatase E1 isoform X3 [Penaeus vannamei]|uniref:enolase-phosphatase E1 isoform X3 n=1 Tax=Penaeus vannamei TaxID=6689 RepID=UPI00387F5422
MLALLLVVGAVTCSPLPSDFPAHAAQDAAHHVEVTHEVRHVTFEVSEEVSDATASSQVPSAVPPEDDPPIPTATTPPTLPDAHLPHHVAQLDLQPAHHTLPEEHGLEEKEEDVPETEGFLSDEPHAEDAVKDEGILGALQEDEDVEVEAKEEEGGLGEDTAAERVSSESASGEHDPQDIARGVVPEDTAAEETSLAEDASAGQEHTEEDQEEKSATHGAELQEHVANESAVEDHVSGESAIQEEKSEQSVAEENAPEESTVEEQAPVENVAIESKPEDSVPEDSDLGESKATGSSSEANTTSEVASGEEMTNENVQAESVTVESVSEEQAVEKEPEVEAHVHPVEMMQADETRETVVLAEPVAEESKEEENKTEKEIVSERHTAEENKEEEKTEKEIVSERHTAEEDKEEEKTEKEIVSERHTAEEDKEEEDETEKEIVSERHTAEEDVAEVAAPEEGEESEAQEDVPQDHAAAEGEAEEEMAAAARDAASHEGDQEEVLADASEQEASHEEPNSTDIMDPRVKKEVEISEEEKRSAEETAGTEEKTEGEILPLDLEASEEEETQPILVAAEGDHAGSPSPAEGQSDQGGVAFVNDAPSSLDSSELSSEEVPIPVEMHTDTEGDSGVEITPAETPRKSRIYIEDDYSDPARVTHPEDPAVPEDAAEEESEHRVVNSGLESMSMTSPTPEVPPQNVPVEATVEEDQVPPANSEEIESVTPPLDAAEPEENVTSVIDKVEEPPAVHETEEEVSVVDDVLPSSSVAPALAEDYPDSYTDPLDAADLPDIDVTHEDLPSKEQPLDKGEDAGAGQPSDHAGEVAGDSSDLAASDHMLEVEAGTPRVLPPQQEQVSAAAPTTLTVGCIIAIVFGVLVSLVILVGVGGFVLYQRRTLNRPKALNSDRGYAGSDSGGYIDDQVRVSYVNSQIDTPKNESSRPSEAQQAPQVLIMLKNLKPTVSEGAASKLRNSLPSMPKIRPINLPNVGQFISKREPRGSNQPGQ